MAGGKMKPTQQTTQKSELPEYARPYFENLMSRAQNASNQAYTPYEGQRIAGFTEDTNQAFDITRGVANRGTPELDLAGNAATGSVEAGRPDIDTSRAYTTNALNRGIAGNQFATDVATRAQSVGFDAGNYQSNAIQQQAFGQQQADQYMSPYMDNVIQRQKDAALRDYNEGRASRETQAINQGAFGGYRDAIQQGVAQRGLANRMNDIDASGRQQAYANAQQQYNADRAASIGAQTTTEQQRLQAAQYGLSGATMALQGAQTLGGLASSQQSAGMQAARDFRDLGVSQQNALIQQAQSLGQVGSQRQGLTLAQAQALNAQGATQQNLEQRGLDTAYQDFINQRDYEKNQTGYLSNILRGVPVTPNTTATQSVRQPSPVAQYGGLAMSALAMLSSGGAINGARK